MSRARPLLIALLALQLALLVAAFVAIAGSSTVGGDFRRERDAVAGCTWTLGLPAQPSASELPGRTCVAAIGRVPLGPASLVREPGYLQGHGMMERWFADQDALHRALAGASEVVLALGAADGAPVERTVPVTRVPLSRALTGASPILLTIFGILAVGTFVAWRRPRDRSAWVLIVLCHAAVGCWTPTIVNAQRGIDLAPWASRCFWYVNVIGAVSASIAIIHQLSTFPAEQFGRWTRLLSLHVPAVLGLGVLALGLRSGGQPVVAFLMLGFVAGVVLVGVSFARARGQIDRLRTRWMLWGFGLPMLAYLVARVPVLLLHDAATDPTDTLPVVASIAAPVGLGVAILKDHLFDIEVVVRRTALGAVVTACVLFLYHLGVSVFARGIATSGASATALQTAFVTAILLTFLLLPAQARLEAALDRVFFRNRSNYRTALARMPKDLVAMRSTEDLARHMLATLAGPMELPRAVIVLAPPFGGGHWTHGDAPPPPDGWGEEIGELADFQLRETLPTDAELLGRWMAASNLEMLIRLRTPESFVGLLACAAPRGRRVVSRDDISLLSAAAGSLALALSQTFAFETIRRINAELEERVEQRTKELEQARLKLYQREKMSALGLLAAGVAHELNTPLGVVVSASDQLAASLGEVPTLPRAGKLAALCRTAAGRAAEIVRRLGDYSRPDRAVSEDIDVATLVATTVHALEATLAARKVAVQQALEPVPHLHCNSGLIHQALSNLIINAAQAMADGGVVTVRARVGASGHVHLVVEDTGPGVPDAIRARIFEPFFTTKPPGEGVGLGLSLCFNIAELHGGTIREEGDRHGARFVLDLPVAPSSDQLTSLT